MGKEGRKHKYVPRVSEALFTFAEAGKAAKLKLIGDTVKKQIRPNIAPKNKLVAILDARHAPTTEFWEVSLPHFWKEKRTVISRNNHVRASQENQFFPRVFRRYTASRVIFSDFVDKTITLIESMGITTTC